jgi:hypothetical protein
MEILAAFNSIIEKSHSVLVEAGAVRPQPGSFKVLAGFPTRGSFDINVQLALVTAGGLLQGLPALAAMGGPTILENVKGAWELCKLLFTGGEDTQPEVSVDRNTGQVTVIKGHNGPLTINHYVIRTASKTNGEYQEIINRLGAGIDEVTMSGLETRLTLSTNDRELIVMPAGARRDLMKVLEAGASGQAPTAITGHEEPRALTQDQVVSIMGEITAVDKERRTGLIGTAGSTTVPAGEYPFAIVGDQDIAVYVEAMLHRVLEIRCYLERRTTGRKKVIRLHVISVGAIGAAAHGA